MLAVYAGTRLNRLTRIAPDRRIFPNDECLVQFAAQPGLSYRVVVQGGGAGVFSRFRLTARAATPPANDRFANATPITLGTTIKATTRDASRELGEPSHYGGPLTVWFRLTVSKATTVWLDGCPTPSLGVTIYTGDQLSQLTRLAFGCQISFDAQPGGGYYIHVETGVDTEFSLSPQAVLPP